MGTIFQGSAVSRMLRLIQACGERSMILSIVAHLGLRSGSRTQKRRESGLAISGNAWKCQMISAVPTQADMIVQYWQVRSVPIGDIACCKHLSKCSANRTRATLIF
jgi:hypothetical protein